MSVNEKAIQREKEEPTELDQRIPSLFLVFIGLMGGWGSSYFYYNAANSHGRGDTRSQTQHADISSEKEASLDGKALYSARCSSCHQASGMGLPGAFPPLKESEWVTANADLPIQIVLRGLQGEIEVNQMKFNGVMPSFSSQLNDEEIAAILGYVRSEFGQISEEGLSAENIAEWRTTVPKTAIQGQKELLVLRDGGTMAISKEASASVQEEAAAETDDAVPSPVKEEALSASMSEDENGAENKRGEQLYQQICSSCHQATGLGIPGAFPPLKDSEWTQKEPELIATIIQRGLMGEIEVAGTTYNSAMPSFGAAFSTEDMVAVVSYVQSSFAQIESNLSLEAVQQIKEAAGAPINGQAELKTLFPE